MSSAGFATRSRVTAGLALVLGVLAFVVYPLAFDVRWYMAPQVVDPILWAKSATLVALASCSVVVLLVASPQIHLWSLPAALLRAPLVVQLIGAAIVLLLVGVVTATRSAPVIGLIGTTIRYDGAFLQIGSLLAFLAVGRAIRASRAMERAYLVMFSVTGVLVATFVAFQSTGAHVWAWLGLSEFTSHDPSATIGHPSLASAYIAMGAALLTVLSVARKDGPHARIRTVVTLAGAVFLAFCAPLAGGRAATVALFLVLGFGAAFSAWQGQRPRRFRNAAVFLAVMGSLAMGLSATDFARDSSKSLGAVVDGADQSWNSRLATYGVAIRALQAQPVRPYGVGAFATVAWENASESQVRQMVKEFVPSGARDSVGRVGDAIVYHDPDTGRPVLIRAVYDKAHNYVLDMWLSFGPFATLAMVLLVVAILWTLGRSPSSTAHAAAVAGLVYAILAQAWFPTINLEPVVWSVLGIGWGVAQRSTTTPRREAAVGSMVLVTEPQSSFRSWLSFLRQASRYLTPGFEHVDRSLVSDPS